MFYGSSMVEVKQNLLLKFKIERQLKFKYYYRKLPYLGPPLKPKQKKISFLAFSEKNSENARKLIFFLFGF